jgi:hypothetical protein
MNSSISNYENSLYLSGLKIYGVSDVNFGYQLPVDHISVLGHRRFRTATSGPPQNSLSVQKYLSPNDFLLNMTGLSPISGGIFYNNLNYSFRQAYLNSYSVSCAVGNFPTLNADFGIYGDIGNALSQSSASQTGILKTIRPADISVDCDGAITNRIESFTYNLECARQAFYHVTGSGAVDVVTIRPFKVNAQFTVGVDDYQSKKLFDYIIDSNKKNITITVGTLATFTMANMELISESINSSATDDLTMTLNYQGFL